MKKARIYILVTVLITLLGIYVFLISPKSLGNENSLAKEKYIFTEKQEDIKTIKIINSNKELVIERVNGENEWKINDADHPNLDPFKTLELIGGLTNIKTNDVVTENKEQLHIYGLDEKAAKVIIEKTNGDVNELIVGNKLPTGNGYYFIVKGEDKVFTIDSHVAKLFHTKVDDLLATERVEIEGNDFKEITYQHYDEMIVIKSIEQLSPNIYSRYYIDKPYETNPQLDEMSEKFEAMITTLASTPALEKVDSNTHDLEQYGLDKPALYVKIESIDGRSRSLAIGNEYKSGLYYANFDDDPTVYSISLTGPNDIFNIQAFELANTTPVFTMIHQIKAIEITQKEEVYQLGFKKLSDAENPEMNFTLNGTEVVEKEMKQFYLSLLELNADAESEKEISNDEADITIKITYENDEETIIEYIPYDRNFYAIVKDGENDFVIAKEKLDKLVHHVRSMEKK